MTTLPQRPPAPNAAPMWATREFRLLVGGAFLALAVVAVVVFEIAPTLRKRSAERTTAALSGKDVFVPGLKREGIAFDGVLDNAVDGTPIDAWDDPYCTLTRHVSTSKPEAVAAGALRVGYRHFARHASELRGRPVTVTAMLVHSDAIRVNNPNAGVKIVHRCYLVDLSGEEGFVVDLIDPPPQVERRGLVSTVGLFLKMGTYDAAGGKKTAALLVGREMKKVVEPRGVGAWSTGAMVVGLCVAALLVIIMLSMRVWNSKPRPPRPEPVSVGKQL